MIGTDRSGEQEVLSGLIINKDGELLSTCVVLFDGEEVVSDRANIISFVAGGRPPTPISIYSTYALPEAQSILQNIGQLLGSPPTLAQVLDTQPLQLSPSWIYAFWGPIENRQRALLFSSPGFESCTAGDLPSSIRAQPVIVELVNIPQPRTRSERHTSASIQFQRAQSNIPLP
jgi:hypothetical protein